MMLNEPASTPSRLYVSVVFSKSVAVTGVPTLVLAGEFSGTDRVALSPCWKTGGLLALVAPFSTSVQLLLPSWLTVFTCTW